MATEFELHGLDDVLKKMRTLGPKLQKKGLRQAARKAMNIVRDAGRVNAQAIDDPETAENIAKNITVREKSKQSRRIGGVVMSVGVMGGASSNQNSMDASGNPGGDTRHWRYEEFGTEHQPANPIMRPALAKHVRTEERSGGKESVSTRRSRG